MPAPTDTDLDPNDLLDNEDTDDLETPLPSDAPPADNQPAAPPAGRAADVVEMPRASLKGLKSRCRSEGRKIERRELTERATALGFASLDALFESATSAKGNPPPPAASKEEPPPVPQDPPAAPTTRVNERDLRLARKYRQERAARVAAQEALEAAQSEADLRLAAVRVGITDPDYALALLRKHIGTIVHDEEALSALNEAEFFTGLKKSAPYLFATQSVPANTGPSGDENPPPAPSGGGDPPPPVDVRSMSKAEYAKYLVDKGLTDPTMGAPV